MNYKEKYEQALMIAKETYNEQPMYRKWLEKMFPELAESEGKPNGGIVREDFTQGNGWYKVNLDYLSKAQVEEIEQLVEKWNPKEVSEDEKIKKAILIYLDWLDGKKDYLPKGDYTIKDMILWLEKQAEQEPNPCNGCINRKGCINCENGELRETEQKPIETVKWSPQEESCICQLESLVKEQWRQAERVHNSVNIKKMSELMFFLKTLNHNKKPTDEEMKRLLQTEYEKGRADAIAEMHKEWSEEDELQMQAIIDLLPGLTIRHNWLKSLKGRVQPKQEWSEEDSVKLQRIIDFLWYNRKGDTDAIYQQEQDIDWLKSLRPQNKWKPSERQLVCLQNTIEHYNLMGSPATTLNEILKQLKKLKEG